MLTECSPWTEDNDIIKNCVDVFAECNPWTEDNDVYQKLCCCVCRMQPTDRRQRCYQKLCCCVSVSSFSFCFVARLTVTLLSGVLLLLFCVGTAFSGPAVQTCLTSPLKLYLFFSFFFFFFQNTPKVRNECLTQ